MRAAPARARDRLGEEAEHRRAQVGEHAARQDLGPEHHDDVRARRPATGASIASASPPARNSTNVVAHAPELLVERAGLEERRLADEREPQRRARRAAPGTGRAPARGSSRPHRRCAGSPAPATVRVTRAECTLRAPCRMAGAHHARDAARRSGSSTSCATRWPRRSSATRRTWLDLGCGAGVAAAAALGGEGPARAVLVDAERGRARAGGARGPGRRGRAACEADLADRRRASPRCARRSATRATACVTCFEVIEHLESFVGVVELLRRAGRASAGSRSC